MCLEKFTWHGFLGEISNLREVHLKYKARFIKEKISHFFLIVPLSII